jgi:hypothetical protein
VEETDEESPLAYDGALLIKDAKSQCRPAKFNSICRQQIRPYTDIYQTIIWMTE